MKSQFQKNNNSIKSLHQPSKAIYLLPKLSIQMYQRLVSYQRQNLVSIYLNYTVKDLIYEKGNEKHTLKEINLKNINTTVQQNQHLTVQFSQIQDMPTEGMTGPFNNDFSMASFHQQCFCCFEVGFSSGSTTPSWHIGDMQSAYLCQCLGLCALP